MRKPKLSYRGGLQEARWSIVAKVPAAPARPLYRTTIVNLPCTAARGFVDRRCRWAHVDLARRSVARLDVTDQLGERGNGRGIALPVAADDGLAGLRQTGATLELQRGQLLASARCLKVQHGHWMMSGARCAGRSLGATMGALFSPRGRTGTRGPCVC